MSDTPKARRIAVRVPSYRTEAEEMKDTKLLAEIADAVQSAWTQAEAQGISAETYRALEQTIAVLRQQMTFPELDVLSGEPMAMLRERLR